MSLMDTAEAEGREAIVTKMRDEMVGRNVLVQT